MSSATPSRKQRVTGWLIAVIIGQFLIIALLTFDRVASHQNARTEDSGGAADGGGETKTRPDDAAGIAQSPLQKETRATKGHAKSPAEFLEGRTYVGATGGVSSLLREDFKLSDEQYRAVLDSVSKSTAKLTAMCASRVRLDETASNNSPDGARIYQIPALSEEERAGLSKELAKNLESIAGKDLADKVVNDLAENPMFSYGGKYDATLRFVPERALKPNFQDLPEAERYMDVPGGYIVSVDLINPKNGQVAIKARGYDLDEVSQLYGNIFH